MDTPIPAFTRPFANALITASRNHFSGRLAVSAGAVTWHLFFRLGRILWIEGGVHPIRRWKRLQERYLAEVSTETIATLHRGNPTPITGSYQALCSAVQKHLATREQLQAAIMDVSMEIMFDILQVAEHTELTYIGFAEEAPSQSLALLKVKDVFGYALGQWKMWQQIELGGYSPNWAPIIVSEERLRQIVSPQAAHRLLNMAQGDQSLRDLAVMLDQDLLRLSRSLLGGVRQGALALVEIADCPASTALHTAIATAYTQPTTVSTPEGLVSSPPSVSSLPITASPATPPPLPAATVTFQDQGNRGLGDISLEAMERATTSNDRPKPMIVHIDDSPQNCGIARSILETAGYAYVDVNDPLNAIPTLLQAKPQLILLDLMMPVVNGYELCAQIRRVSSLQNVPIVMLTSQDGIIDRVRAKVVKASAFLAKPINPRKLLDTVGQFAPINTLP